LRAGSHWTTFSGVVRSCRGEGARPYHGLAERPKLTDATTFDSGVTLLRYEPGHP
jgi:hypothetical protein